MKRAHPKNLTEADKLKERILEAIYLYQNEIGTHKEKSRLIGV